MKLSLSIRKSLRARLFIGLFAMLLPFLVLGGGTYYSFRLLSASLNEVVQEALEEMVPISQLEIAVQQGRATLHQYVHDPNERDRLRVEELSSKVDEAFVRSMGLPLGSAEKRDALNSAFDQWRQARQALQEILTLTEPGENPEVLSILKRVDRHVDRTVELLEKVHHLAETEIAEELKAVDAVKQKIALLNSTIFLAGVGMALTIGLLLSRSILRPVRRLDEGLKRFAEGELSYRLTDVGKDELGALTTAFNEMADELERDRQALKELAVCDPLTGLFNHREFFRLLRDEAERSRRYRHPVSLLMLDLDHFKRINDTYGHPAGDKVLCAVSAIIRRELRQVDHVARYGGEEFAVILPETAESEAFAIASRIRQSVAARPLAVSETGKVNLTISIGLAVFPDDAAIEEELVKKADRALYHAKEAGRNRVCRSSSAG